MRVTIIFSLMLIAFHANAADQALVIHEWGTITTAHKASGDTKGYLNKIEPWEVLPDFVHRYEPPVSEATQGRFAKTPVGQGHPDVTMRLETPVLYFYPSDHFNFKKNFTVEAKLRGGIINEYYPKALASQRLDTAHINVKTARGTNIWDGRNLNNYLVGSLQWSDLKLSMTGRPPKTKDNVWLAPRKVDAAYVKQEKETERYLFYRGVAHLEAPLRTKHDKKAGEIQFFSPTNFYRYGEKELVIPYLWLLKVKPDGSALFKKVGQVTIDSQVDKMITKTFLNTNQNEFKKKNLAELRRLMHAALVAQGLYDKEADAMLTTWDHAYFRKPGTRALYIVPKKWVDHHIPLSISIPNELTRVFVGRIDLDGI